MTEPDLNAALETHLGHYASVVLLNGLAINRTELTDKEMRWTGLGRNGPEEIAPTALADLISAGIAGGRISSNQAPDQWFVLPRIRGPVLQLRWQELQRQAFETLSDGYQLPAMNLLYVVGAARYHLERLLELYNAISLRSLGSSLASAFKDDQVVLSGEVEPYFEIEALISATARSFETARYPIWQAFGLDQGCPRKFETAMRKVELPEELQTWRKQWLGCYLRLREYRDCFHHNAHFGARLPFAMANRVNGYWGLLVRLPDNPESKSYGAFTYDENIDALHYGWNLVNDLFDFTEETFGAIQRNAA